MRGGPILVTGGLGNLGHTLVLKLLDAGRSVRVLDVDHRQNRSKLRALEARGVSGVLGSITAQGDVATAMRGVSAVAHLAGILPPASERNPAATHAVNVTGTQRLVDAAVTEDESMPFVLASSVSVYGPRNCSPELVTAETPAVPTDAYTRSKVEAEKILQASPLGWTVMRIGASAEGSKLAADRVVMRLMFEIDPEQPIELVHGADVATAFAHAIEREEARRKVLLIGGGPRCRMRQAELLAASFRILGISELPSQAYGRAPYYTHFMDGEEAQRILGHQKHAFTDIERDLAARFGPLRRMLPLFAPITRAVMLRMSGPYRGAPSRPTFEALIASERD